jgi:hypothetical protein
MVWDTAFGCIGELCPDRPIWYFHREEKSSLFMAASGIGTLAHLDRRFHAFGLSIGFRNLKEIVSVMPLHYTILDALGGRR